jgi:signal transduction histidine kinase
MTPGGDRSPRLIRVWLRMAMRAVWLLFTLLAVGARGQLNLSLLVVVGLWAVLIMLSTLREALGGPSSPALQLESLLEGGLALAAVGVTGPIGSPLWSALLLPPLSLALTQAWRHAAFLGGAELLLAGALALGPDPSSGARWAATSEHLLAVTAAAGLIGVPLRSTVRAAWKPGDAGQGIARPQPAGELWNHALDLDKVLAGILDSTQQLLQEDLGPLAQPGLGVWLPTENGLVLAKDHRLRPRTYATLLSPDEPGLLTECLQQKQRRQRRDPRADPDLKGLAGLKVGHLALAIPLLADGQAQGVLLIGLPDHSLSPASLERLDLLVARAGPALRTARAFYDLALEKDANAEIQEETRRKLARDLHDGPTQSVAAIAMRVNYARRLIERDTQAAESELVKIEDLARSTTREIRHMLFTLRPLILESQGLVAALEQLAVKVEETHGRHVELDLDPDAAKRLNRETQTVLFFIAEEAINNARKHAEAEHVWVRLRSVSGEVILDVQDDGVGFNVGSVDANYGQRGSLGMVTMRERTALVSGRLQIESEEGKGTRLIVRIPQDGRSASEAGS